MTASPRTLLWPLVVLAALGLLATATITFAATKRIQASTASAPKAAAPADRPPLVVPDVRGKPYVFAKGILDDAGFAWRVSTKNGYATNTVSSQTPSPGARVVDTGAPLMGLALKVPGGQKESGTADNESPFESTPLKLVSAGKATSAPAPASAPKAHKTKKHDKKAKAKAKT
jgi:beta-lactam-binding protein with PASTA domain